MRNSRRRLARKTDREENIFAARYLMAQLSVSTSAIVLPRLVIACLNGVPASMSAKISPLDVMRVFGVSRSQNVGSSSKNAWRAAGCPAAPARRAVQATDGGGGRARLPCPATTLPHTRYRDGEWYVNANSVACLPNVSVKDEGRRPSLNVGGAGTFGTCGVLPGRYTASHWRRRRAR